MASISNSNVTWYDGAYATNATTGTGTLHRWYDGTANHLRYGSFGYTDPGPAKPPKPEDSDYVDRVLAEMRERIDGFRL